MASSSCNDILPLRIDRNFDFWNSYSDGHLKELCVAFGLPSVGGKKEKAARLCVAWEIGKAPVANPTAIDELRKQELAAKWNRSPISIPNPTAICADSWETGDASVRKIPLIDRQCLLRYYLRGTELENVTDYVNTVAFGLFENGHVGAISVFDDEGTPWTLLKTMCKSSMARKSYAVWIVLDRSASEIETAYCECMAGLPGYCKHAFAALFKLEFWSSSGCLRPTCTDLPCQWNQPTGSAQDAIIPKRICEVEWRRTEADHASERSLVTEEKRNYVSCDDLMTNDDVAELLQAIAADQLSCTAAVVQNYATAGHVVEPLSVIIDRWRLRRDLSLDEKKKRCTEAIKDYFTITTIEKIGAATIGQSTQPEWMMHRRLRITASSCKIANNAVKRSKREFETETDHRAAVVEKLLPTYYLNQLKGIRFTSSSLEYGREHEEEALQKYLAIHRVGGCPDAVVDRSGLVVCQSHPYLGASPDGILKCEKHGQRLVEIKCPSSANKSTPASVFNVYYMDKESKCMKKNEYFEQTMMQMALCKIHECDLFIWCANDYYIEKCVFSYETWNELKSNLVWYYENVVLEKVLNE